MDIPKLIKQSEVLKFIKFSVHVQDPNNDSIVNVVDIHTGALLSAADMLLKDRPEVTTYEEGQAAAMLKMFDTIEENFQILKLNKDG